MSKHRRLNFPLFSVLLDSGSVVPPVPGSHFLLLDGTDFLLLNSTFFLLLEL